MLFSSFLAGKWRSWYAGCAQWSQKSQKGHSQRGAVSSVVGDRLLRCALPRAVPSTSIGKIKLKEDTITPPRASAQLSGGSGVLSVAPVVRYELKAADKALVLERCRVF